MAITLATAIAVKVRITVCQKSNSRRPPVMPFHKALNAASGGGNSTGSTMRIQ